MEDIAVLHVGSCSSRCGVCNKQAFPHEKIHAKEAGYGLQGPGCGVEWTHITSDYLIGGKEKEILSGMRPDLIYI